MKRMIISLLLICFWAVPVQGAVKGEAVSYKSDGLTMNGYMAYDDSKTAKRPGVLVVHEWWGHNDYARKRARMLAELGYVALAVDMYGDGKTAEHPQDAGKFATEVRQNMPVATLRFKAAMQLLKDHPMVDRDHIAAIGYCFGGGLVLQMARLGLDLDAVISFHGSLATETPAVSGAVKARILVCTGAEDKMVPPKQVQDFQSEMENAGIDYKIISYPGAEHSFTNPGADIYAEKFNIPVGYNADADRKSWQAMQDFLNVAFSE